MAVSILEICEAVFSGHIPILFEADVTCSKVKTLTTPQRCCVVNPCTAVHFSTAFEQNCVIPESVCSMEELSLWFHSTCQTVVDTVVPFKIRQPKTISEPWLDDGTCVARCECRRAERKWEKDKLQVLLQMLRGCWRHYQETVRDAKKKKTFFLNYFIELSQTLYFVCFIH